MTAHTTTYLTCDYCPATTEPVRGLVGAALPAAEDEGWERVRRPLGEDRRMFYDLCPDCRNKSPLGT